LQSTITQPAGLLLGGRSWRFGERSILDRSGRECRGSTGRRCSIFACTPVSVQDLKPVYEAALAYELEKRGLSIVRIDGLKE
jgi:hypothetical protein